MRDESQDRAVGTDAGQIAQGIGALAKFVDRSQIRSDFVGQDLIEDPIGIFVAIDHEDLHDASAAGRAGGAEVGRAGMKGHVTPICGDGWGEARAIGLQAGSGDTDAGGGVEQQVADKDVGEPVVVLAHQVARRARKSDKASIGTNYRIGAVIVGDRSGRGAAD